MLLENIIVSIYCVFNICDYKKMFYNWVGYIFYKIIGWDSLGVKEFKERI